MAVVAPCITVETPDDYQASIERLSPFAKRVHIDISDGEFAPRFLLGADQLTWPEGWEVDIHAMLARPSEYLATLINLRPSLVVLHAEASEDIAPLLQQLKDNGIKAGLGLLKTTVPKTVAPLIQLADHVMIFSGELGQYGGIASMMQLEKIRLVRMIHPEVEIGWDGGARAENAFSLTQGGVDVINVGGAISKSDNPQAVYEKILSEANKHGVI